MPIPWCSGAKDGVRRRFAALVETAEESCGGTSEAAEILDRDEISEDGCERTGPIRLAYRDALSTGRADILRGPASEKSSAPENVFEDLCGQAIDLFCYPNGETSPEAIDLVRRHYLGAVTTLRGWHNASGDPHLIRRIGVHEDVSNARDPFLERLSGWL